VTETAFGDQTWVSVGALMRSLRRSAGATLDSTAKGVGRSKGHLSNVEHGKDRPSPEIIEYYEVTFGGDGVLWSLYGAARSYSETRSTQPGGSPYPLDGDASEFIADITVPDGSVFRPSERFVKTWRIKNAGTVQWVGRYLQRVGAPVAHSLPRSARRVPIPPTMPGETVDISVPVKAQDLEGTAIAYWKMADADGRWYFPDRYAQGLVLTIRVVQLH
jgi:transcriptional regulator with XRE-family HTH domain